MAHKFTRSLESGWEVRKVTGNALDFVHQEAVPGELRGQTAVRPLPLTSGCGSPALLFHCTLPCD